MSSRRDFLKHAGSMGIGFGLGPALAPCLQGRAEAADIAGSQAVKAGRAEHLTILHTSDIHGQIEIHDEFFYERGRPAFRRSGGFATLRTMINALRRQNPEHTLVVDGGDCFQGSAVAALSKGQPTDRARCGLHPRRGHARAHPRAAAGEVLQSHRAGRVRVLHRQARSPRRERRNQGGDVRVARRRPRAVSRR